MLHSRLLKYIEEVARTGSIRRAAENLNVASSAVNRQIIGYEEMLGQKLFERLPRGVRLTATGELLVEHIRMTLKDHDRLLQRIGDMKGLRRARISLATLEALNADVVAQIAGRFLEQHPFVHLDVQAVPAQRIPSAVAAGEAMLGLGFDIQSEANLRVLASVPCSLGVVVAPAHPLAVKGTVRLSDCVGHAFVLPSETLSLRRMIDRLFQKANVALHPVVETNSVDLLKRLVSMSNLATFLTRADVEMDRLKGQLVFIPLPPAQNEAQRLTLVQRHSTPPSPAMTLFSDEIIAFIRRIGDP